MDLKQKIEELVTPVLNDRNLRLVELKIQGSFRNPAIEVFADSENGITLGECEALTRRIRDELDMDGSFDNNYRLSVSSPGLDRPLQEDWEFQKNIGKALKVKYSADGVNRQEEGTLLRWDEDSIELDTETGSVLIPRGQIVKAKIKLKW
jgi:ribosome maturation factor RimP